MSVTRLEHLEHSPSIESYVLWPASLLYAFGWTAYESMYQLGLKTPKHPHSPTIVIGNLVVGGTGKTPFTSWFVQELRRLGHSVVVSASGYGSPASAEATLAPEGPLRASEWGDEPATYRWLIPDLPLIVGRNRVRAAEICAAEFPDSILVLDDGYQHLPLQKDISIVLDAEHPMNPFCLPAGPYRQPRSRGRKGPDVVLPRDYALKRIGPIFRDRTGQQIESPEPGPIQVLCALGQPTKFLSMLDAAGWQVTQARLLRDHDPLQAGNLWDGLNTSEPIMVTAKDWVKLQERGDLDGKTIWIADYALRVDPEAEFLLWLQKRLDEIQAKRT